VIKPSATNGLVSVIIPAYNVERFIAEAVDSALAQSYTYTEVIVVDDGSTDHTRKVLEVYGDRIKIVSQPNSGAGAARNRGMLEANGEYFAFLDGDDIWFPDKIEKELNILTKNEDVCLVSGIAECVDESGSRINVDLNYRRDVYNRSLHLYNELLQRGNPIWTSSVVVRKSALKDTGLFDESKKRSQDYDMWIRLSEKNKFYVMGEKLGRYRWINSSLTHSSISHEYEAQMEILQKHSWRYGHAAYRRRLSGLYSAWAESESCYGSLGRGIRLTLKSLRLNPFVVRPYVQMIGSFIKNPIRRLLGRNKGYYEGNPR
jgi:glycosyltransferase involved in cell wall biosynthesis